MTTTMTMRNKPKSANRLCKVCGKSEQEQAEQGHIFSTINGHHVCGNCDHDFCFQCGSHPVELLGEASVCAGCHAKAGDPEKLL